MTGTVWEVALAGLVFLGTHFGLSSTGLRPALVRRLSEGGYLGLYSAISLAAIVWLVSAYGAAPYVPLWDPAPWQQWVAVVVMPLVVLLAVGGYLAPNPMAFGQGNAVTRNEPARGLQRITRHPFLWGTGLWGLVHVLSNGDGGSVAFFGTFVILGIGGAYLIDAKKRAKADPRWEQYMAATSTLPFAAIMGGRQSLGRAVAEFGAVRLAVAALAYGGLLYAHPWLFGVAAVPG